MALKNVVNSNLLNYLWENGILPLKTNVASKVGTSSILKTKEEFEATTSDSTIPGAVLMREQLDELENILSDIIVDYKKISGYTMCPVLTDKSTTSNLIVDLTSIEGYENLTLDDIYPFFSYNAVYGNNGQVSVSYSYDSSLGELSISIGTSTLLEVNQLVRVMVNPTNAYELPIVYVDGKNSYIDLTSIPNYQELETKNINIRISEIFNIYGNGSSGSQYLLYDPSEGKLHYKGTQTFNYGVVDRAAKVAIKLWNDSDNGNKILFKIVNGELQWKEQGADTWNPFTSSIQNSGFKWTLVNRSENTATPEIGSYGTDTSYDAVKLVGALNASIPPEGLTVTLRRNSVDVGTPKTLSYDNAPSGTVWVNTTLYPDDFGVQKFLVGDMFYIPTYQRLLFVLGGKLDLVERVKYLIGYSPEDLVYTTGTANGGPSYSLSCQVEIPKGKTGCLLTTYYSNSRSSVESCIEVDGEKIPWVEGYEYRVALLSNLTDDSVINILGYRQNTSSAVYVTYTAIWTEDFKEFLPSISYGKNLFIFYKENYKNGTGVYTIKLYANSEKILEESHTTTNTTYSASYDGVTYIITVTYTSGEFIYNIYHDSVSSENLIVTKTISSANSDVVFWESDKEEEILQDNEYDYYTVNLITNSGTTKEVQIANTSGPYTDYDTVVVCGTETSTAGGFKITHNGVQSDLINMKYMGGSGDYHYAYTSVDTPVSVGDKITIVTSATKWSYCVLVGKLKKDLTEDYFLGWGEINKDGITIAEFSGISSFYDAKVYLSTTLSLTSGNPVIQTRDGVEVARVNFVSQAKTGNNYKYVADFSGIEVKTGDLFKVPSLSERSGLYSAVIGKNRSPKDKIMGNSINLQIFEYLVIEGSQSKKTISIPSNAHNIVIFMRGDTTNLLDDIPESQYTSIASLENLGGYPAKLSVLNVEDIETVSYTLPSQSGTPTRYIVMAVLN